MKGKTGTSMNMANLSDPKNPYNHKERDLCPSCNSSDRPKGGILVKRVGQFREFLGCSRYPECKYTIQNGKRFSQTGRSRKNRIHKTIYKAGEEIKVLDLIFIKRGKVYKTK